ncbi:hypothetical protein FDP41_005383 [Naegleria fowleri]|uniref:DUF4116 domain-containing protein n=1 Tax=Naegleria fowleri TaxID=5763 RepID=A0A6A5BR21_NAEFO|nr:uncharacterized protein FDP41_005383 [Naegleria fowleri]KAF0975389.1 hypothetical protein FDP41_005383 [Naegleria fowleri]
MASSVVIELISFYKVLSPLDMPCRRLESLLKQKFSLQQEGKKKWLLNGEILYRDFIPIEFMNDKEIVWNHIKNDNLRNDKELVLEAIKHNENALEDASFSLQRDKNFVLEAIRWNEKCLCCAAYEFLKDSEFVFEAIKQNKKALRWVPCELLTNEAFMLKVIKFIFPEFHHLDSFEHANKEIMMKLVNEFGFLLIFASDELKNDRDIVSTAIRNDGLAFAFASHNLSSLDVETFSDMYQKKLLRTERIDLPYNDPPFFNDKEIVLEVVKNDGFALKYASNELRKDRGLVMEAVKSNGYALFYASEELQNNHELVMQWI